MRKTLALFALAAIIAIPVLSTSMTPAQAAPEVGQAAPGFTATDIDGNEFNLADHKGKIVVLEWTNHQCPFVMKHYNSGNMQKVQKAVKDQGVEWVTIVSSAEGRQGNTTPEEAAQIVEDAGAIITTKILDASGKIGKLYDAKTTPHMFIIDTNGVLAYVGAIDSNSSPNPATIEGAENYVLAAVDDLVSGNEVRTPRSQPYGCSVKYAY